MESGATVEPVLVNRDKFLELIGVAEPVESLPQPVLEENSFVPEPPYDENDSNVRIILFMFIGLCCCFVVILVVVVTILVLRRRQKLN